MNCALNVTAVMRCTSLYCETDSGQKVQLSQVEMQQLQPIQRIIAVRQ
jgi:hypothetical protein